MHSGPRGIERGKTSQEQKNSWAGNLTAEVNLAKAVDDCQLVIEAVPEILDLKQQLFQELEALCSEDTVFATNTSSLSIGKIASVLNRPERLIGMHFFNPVPIMKLLELVKHKATNDDTVSICGVCWISDGEDYNSS